MLIIQLIKYNICNITCVIVVPVQQLLGINESVREIIVNVNIRGINTHNYYTILDIHNSLHQRS